MSEVNPIDNFEGLSNVLQNLKDFWLNFLFKEHIIKTNFCFIVNIFVQGKKMFLEKSDGRFGFMKFLILLDGDVSNEIEKSFELHIWAMFICTNK